jgi:flagellar motor switch protein FliN/FliY
VTLTAQRLLPHFEACVQAAADTMTFASVHAGNVVAIDDPTPALPLGGVRMLRATVTDDIGLEVVLALTDPAADEACLAAGTDDLADALGAVVNAVVGGLSALVGSALAVAGLNEMGIGEPLGAPGTEIFTAGLFNGEEQIGNVIFFVVPDALAPPGPDIATAAFPDTDTGAAGAFDDAHANPLSLLRGVEMRVTAELGRTRLPVAHVLELGAGSVVELDRVAGSPVDILANGTLIARGEVVVVDEEYGVRITEILGAEESA